MSECNKNSFDIILLYNIPKIQCPIVPWYIFSIITVTFWHLWILITCIHFICCRPEVFAVNSFLFRDSDRTALFSDLNCQGTETNLAECNYSSLYNYKCTHGRDIALICKAGKNTLESVFVLLSKGIIFKALSNIIHIQLCLDFYIFTNEV